MSLSVHLKTQYEVECWREGVCIWTEQFHNLVTVVGQNKLLDACFKTGESANQWFVGLVNNASFTGYSVNDTMASHAGWLEAANYSQANRPAFVATAPVAGSITNAAAPAVFTITSTLTVRGAFLIDVHTISGTLGVLYGVGDFTSQRIVLSSDTINATLTITD